MVKGYLTFFNEKLQSAEHLYWQMRRTYFLSDTDNTFTSKNCVEYGC